MMAFWTYLEVDSLRDLTGKGYSASQISAALGTKSKNAVISQWRRMGDSLARPSHNARNQNINAMLKQLWIGGYSVTEIAAETQLTTTAVKARITRMQTKAKERFARKRRPSAQNRVDNRTKAMERQAILMGKTAQSSAEKPPKSAIKFLNLKSNSCRYIFGEADGINTVYCGNESCPGFSYCAGHARLCIDPVHHSRRRIRDTDRNTAGVPSEPAA